MHKFTSMYPVRFYILTDLYESLAEEVLAQAPKGGRKQARSTSGKHTMGDVWLAELAYRIVARKQRDEWAESVTLITESLQVAKEGERQRRMKLRSLLHHGILQTQADAFQRVQQSHAEALEDWVAKEEGIDEGRDTISGLKDTTAVSTGVEGGRDSKRGEQQNSQVKPIDEADGEVTIRTEKSKRKKNQNQKKLSVKQYIRQIGKSHGAKAIFDEDEKKEERDTAGGSFASDSVSEQLKKSAIDVDFLATGNSSSDDDNLPLLKDARTATASPASGTSRSKQSRTNEKKRKERRRARKKRGSRNMPVVFDKSSKSMSLLESHFVKFSALACLEEIPAPAPIVTGNKEEADANFPPAALVVITCDDILHVFDLGPVYETELSADEALYCLLEEREEDALETARDLHGCTPCVVDTSTSKFFRRNKDASDEPLARFQFSMLRPELSLPLNECSVRMTKRGGYAVKITTKDRLQQESIRFTKLNLASARLQNNLVDACRADNETLVSL
jgi:hypothetical protein